MRIYAAPSLGLVLLAGSVGCASVVSPGRPTHPPRHAVTLSEVESSRCVRGAPGRNTPYHEQLPGAVSEPELAVHLERFSPEVRRAAQAAGIEPRLALLLRERATAGDEPSVAILSMRQELEAQLGSLGTQLLTVEFEAECMIALIKQMMDKLEADERSRQLALAVSSLVVGATAATAAGVWELAGDDSNGPVAVGIAGGSASALLGAATFLPKRRSVVFIHEHNLLTPIVSGEDVDNLYPTFVFRLLTLPHVTGAPTPRETLLAEWRRLIAETLPADERERAEAVLFGNGGVYDAELLALHQRLFETLESTADSLQRDIDLLNAAVHGALDED
jgi:hypothetical protein